MAISRRVLAATLGLCTALIFSSSESITVKAGSNNTYLDSFNSGVAAMLDLNTQNAAKIMRATETQFITLASEDAEESTLVMANVKSTLNVREEAGEKAKKVGKIYKDCGGIILERKDGWTKLQSGNLIGWAKDEYLLFGEEARALAESVGKNIAVINADAVNIRKDMSTDAEIYGVMTKDIVLDVISVEEDGWVCVDMDGKDGYVLAELVDLEFKIDYGETLEEIKVRKEAEKEAKRYKNYGEFTTDEDTMLLLAALIHCEARGESYEGQLAVGAVVMNRVRSKAYPDTIHGVIYASGQFTPACTGKLDRVVLSGNIKPSCIQAAQEALNGVTNVGDALHFRRVGKNQGFVIGNHVFW
jgi:uncharacterized protein YgiM (DUF1202 family)